MPDDGRSRSAQKRTGPFVLKRDAARVLVTGLKGFTGRYVAEELERAGYAVCGLGCEEEGSTISRQTARVDILDTEAVRLAVARIRPAAVIHLAAIAFVAHENVETIYRTNIVGTHHLLAALADLSIPPKCVFASSANVYGNAGGRGGLLDEGTMPAPTNDYAISKLAMEHMARTWAGRLPITVVRPFNYTGVSQDPRFLIPKIVEHFRRSERRIALGNLDVWREFMDVRTVAWVYRRLLETAGAGETFNICTGQVHSLREVLKMMAGIADYAIDVEVDSSLVRDNEVQRLGGDPALLQRRIGPLPPRDLSETLRWMYRA